MTLRLAAAVLILALAQTTSADYTHQSCYVSGALLYGGIELNGEYVPTGKWVNNKYVWGLYDSGSSYELSAQTVNLPVTNRTSMGWTLSRTYSYPWSSNTIYAKLLEQVGDYWYTSPSYSSTPDASSGWLQYDPILKTFFRNTQMVVDCRENVVSLELSELSTGAIVGIVLASIWGCLILVGLLICVCRKCRKSKQPQAHNTPHKASEAKQFGYNNYAWDVEKPKLPLEQSTTSKLSTSLQY